MRFLVSVEFDYRVTDAHAWGRRWAQLSDLQLGSPTYLQSLATLTREVTDVSSYPSAHAFSRICTNDGLLADIDGPGFAEWELREFHLNSSGFLAQHSVQGTPDTKANRTPGMLRFINQAPTVRGVPVLPEYGEGASSINEFASSLNPLDISHFNLYPGTWWVGNEFTRPLPAIPGTITSRNHPQRRHLFSLHTCNSCHGVETSTAFRHVVEAPFSPNRPTVLSGFLTGRNDVTNSSPFLVRDPYTSEMRAFSDLERRRQDLQDLIDTPPIRQFIGNSRDVFIDAH
jgi:hypothetical protein